MLYICSVSCIIVDSITFAAQDVARNPSAQQWIQFFTWLYGSTSQIVLVLTINYQDYQTMGIASKKEIQAMVNRDVEMDMDEKIKWYKL